MLHRGAPPGLIDAKGAILVKDDSDSTTSGWSDFLEEATSDCEYAPPQQDSSYGMSIRDVMQSFGSPSPTNWERIAAALPRDDIGAAEFLARQFTGIYTYSLAKKMWRIWDGTVHRLDTSGETSRMLISFAKEYESVMDALFAAYKSHLKACGDPALKRMISDEWSYAFSLHQAFKLRIKNSPGQKNLQKAFADVRAVDEDEFDKSTRWFVTGGGVIDLKDVWETKRVELLPHDPARLVTMRSPCEWDPEAECPVWEEFLTKSVPDADMRTFLHRWIGQSISGNPRDKGFINLIGPTDSGKSVFADAVAHAMGDYAAPVAASVFLAKQPGARSFDLHEVRGRRLVIAVEPDSSKRLDDQVVKSLTGGDMQTTDGKYEKPVRWRPQATPVIASNHVMRFNTDDEALMLRIKPVSFPNTFKRGVTSADPYHADLRLPGIFKDTEAEGILRWIVEGLIDYSINGVGDEPASVRALRESMSTEVSSSLQWFEERVISPDCTVFSWKEPDPSDIKHNYVSTEAAYADYQSWCMTHGIHHPDQQLIFSRKVGARIKRQWGIGSGTVKSSGSRFVGVYRYA